jgi:hypothetical protein
MAEADLTKLTRVQKLRCCIAYLAEGNSLEDLCIQLIETIGGTDIESGAVEEFFGEIVEEMERARKDDPDCFETTTEEEVQSLIKSFENNHFAYVHHLP